MQKLLKKDFSGKILSLRQDSLWIICSFFGSSSAAFNFMMSCKTFYEFGQSPNFYSGFNNVIFFSKLWKLAKKFPGGSFQGIEKIIPTNIPFVRKLAIDHCLCPSITLCKFLGFFPNLTYLDVSQITAANDEVLKDLRLQELVIMGCSSVTPKVFENTPLGESLTSISVTKISMKCLKRRKEMSESSTWLPKLRELKLLHDRCFTLNPIKVSEEMLRGFPNLEKIYAIQCTLVGEKPFVNQKNLRFLDISRCNSNVSSDVRNSIIEDLENIETLKMNNIQYIDRQNENEIKCGKVTRKGFKNMKKLRHLELEANWAIEPEIFKELPSLQVLNVASTNDLLIETAQKLDLKLLKVCLCIDLKPKKKEYQKMKLECDCKKVVHYQCIDCMSCPTCKKELKTCNIGRCVDCNKDFCEECKKSRASGCEDCAEAFCGCKRKTKFFGGYCMCEWEVLCTKCLGKSYFAGIKCDGCFNDFGYYPVKCCNRCVKGCDTCEKQYCFECTSTQFSIDDDFDRVCLKCRRCKKTIATEDCCQNCVEKKRNEDQIGKCESCKWDLCMECCKNCKNCPSCGLKVCFREKNGKTKGCLSQCPMCKKKGCLNCLGFLIEDECDYSGRDCGVCNKSGCEDCRGKYSCCSHCDDWGDGCVCQSCSPKEFTKMHGKIYCKRCIEKNLEVCACCGVKCCPDPIETCEICEKGGYCCGCGDDENEIKFVCKDCFSEYCESCDEGFCKKHYEKHKEICHDGEEQSESEKQKE